MPTINYKLDDEEDNDIYDKKNLPEYYRAVNLCGGEGSAGINHFKNGVTAPYL